MIGHPGFGHALCSACARVDTRLLLDVWSSPEVRKPRKARQCCGCGAWVVAYVQTSARDRYSLCVGLLEDEAPREVQP